MFNQLDLFVNEQGLNQPLPIPRNINDIRYSSHRISDYLNKFSTNPIAPHTKSGRDSFENLRTGLKNYVLKSIKESGEKFEFVKISPLRVTRPAGNKPGQVSLIVDLKISKWPVILFLTFHNNLGFYIAALIIESVYMDSDFRGKPPFKNKDQASYEFLSQIFRDFGNHMRDVFKVEI